MLCMWVTCVNRTSGQRVCAPGVMRPECGACWPERGVCVQLGPGCRGCVGKWAPGGYSRGPQEGGVYEGRPICGGPQQVGGTCVHVCVSVCVPRVSGRGGSVHLGRRDAVRLCLLSPCYVSVYCVCVWVSRLQDSVLPQAAPPRGPGPCPRLPWSRGFRASARTPPPRPLIEARFLWAPPLWPPVPEWGQGRPWPLSLRAWRGTLALGMDWKYLPIPDLKWGHHI